MKKPTKPTKNETMLALEHLLSFLVSGGITQNNPYTYLAVKRAMRLVAREQGKDWYDVNLRKLS
jgi:hypothetical protein